MSSLYRGGAEGTTATGHTSGTAAVVPITVGSLTAWNANTVFQYGLSGTLPVGAMYDSSGVLTASSFTLANGSGATVTDSAGGLSLIVPAGSGGFDLSTMLLATPSTPYSVQCALSFMTCGANFCSLWAGLALSDSSGKLVTHGLFANGSGTLLELATSKLSSSSAEVGDYVSNVLFFQGLHLWLKISDDGTNFTFYRSADGVSWVQHWQVRRTDYLTAGPTTCGLFFGVDGTAPTGASTATAAVTVAHYSQG
jgi:hypothetical protein